MVKCWRQTHPSSGKSVLLPAATTKVTLVTAEVARVQGKIYPPCNEQRCSLCLDGISLQCQVHVSPGQGESLGLLHCSGEQIGFRAVDLLGKGRRCVLGMFATVLVSLAGKKERRGRFHGSF